MQLRGLAEENQENRPKQNQVASTSTIIIDDDSELEEGEIVDDDSHATLMKETRNALQKAKSITENPCTSISVATPPLPSFYEDKNLDDLSEAQVPLYTTAGNERASQHNSSDVICLDGTLDDSVIFVPPPVNALKRPSCLSTPVINKLLGISAPKTQNIAQNADVDTSPRKQKRTQRAKAYMAKKKLLRLANLTKEQLSEMSTAPVSLQLPSTSTAAAAVHNQLTKTVTVTQTYAEVLAPPPPPLISSSAAAPPQDQRGKSPPKTQTKEKRIILIDGSNVALGYSEAKLGKLRSKSDKNFSAEGLNIAINHFIKLGYQVKAVIPEFRVCRNQSSNQDLMIKMKDSGLLLLTAAKSYDDLMLLQSAKKLNAAIVSNDFFRKYTGASALN
jgi:hypothetical protein